MDTQAFLDHMNNGDPIEGKEIFEYSHKLSQEALKITAEINNCYHVPEELRKLFSELVGYEVDSGFGSFPPFHTDCGKNIHLGHDVFINSGCHFQDQGGITIGDRALIGHNTVIATLEHDLMPERRAVLYPSPVVIGNDVWIGSNSTILPGVTIGSGAVIGAGSVVTKDVAPMTVAAGDPAREIRKIECEI